MINYIPHNSCLQVNNGLFTVKASVNSPIQSLVFNPGHSYLLLVDNGTTEGLPYDLNKFWVELENHMKSEMLSVYSFLRLGIPLRHPNIKKRTSIFCDRAGFL